MKGQRLPSFCGIRNDRAPKDGSEVVDDARIDVREDPRQPWRMEEK